MKGSSPTRRSARRCSSHMSGTRRNDAGVPRSMNGAARACRRSRLRATRPASPGPGRQCRRGAWPRSTRRICWAISTRRSATAERRHCAPSLRAIAQSGRFSMRSIVLPTRCCARLTTSLSAAVRRLRPVRSARRAAGRAGAEPSQGLYTLRHGTVSGPPLRPGRERRHCPRSRRADRGGRDLSASRPLQADHPRCAGRDCSAPGRSRRGAGGQRLLVGVWRGPARGGIVAGLWRRGVLE